MIKYIIVLILIGLISVVNCESCQTFTFVDDMDVKCSNGLWIAVDDQISGSGMIYIEERWAASFCMRGTNQFYYGTMNDSQVFTVPQTFFNVYTESEERLKIISIEYGYTQIEVCYDPQPPIPTPTPDIPEEAVGNDSSGYGMDDTSMGSSGGKGEIYDGIGEGLGDGGTGIAEPAEDLFNAIIPILFMGCSAIFIWKVLGFNR